MRIFIDCTDTHVVRSNSGIQRVVRNVVAHRRTAARALGVECVAVVHLHGAFRAVEEVNPARVGPKALRNRLDEHYWNIVRAVAVKVRSPALRRFLLAHRRDFGLARILFSVLAPLQWLASVGRRAASEAPAVAMEPGDILYLPDAAWFSDLLDAVERAHARGVHIAVLLYDLIPLTHPQFCHPSHVQRFDPWLRRMESLADAFLCISAFTEAAFRARYAAGAAPPSAVTLLGHDLPPPASGTIGHARLRAALDTPDPAFLCVGTVDNRKNQAALLDAFEQVWTAAPRARLILIGAAGWRTDDLGRRIRRHRRFGRELFWFNDVGDADLVLTYPRARALVFPSLAEGFGLPIVEALSYGTPVLASDIEVFREIGGKRVRYFDPRDVASLATLVLDLARRPRGTDAAPEAFRWPTWEESTRAMLEALLRLCPPSG